MASEVIFDPIIDILTDRVMLTRHIDLNMTTAEDLRRETTGENRDRERYACGGCGSLLGTNSDTCPECGGTDIVPVEEIIDPEFRA